VKIAFLAISLALVSGFAQSTITGTIEDDKKQPVAAAKVTLRDSNGAGIQSPVSTDAAGKFQFGSVPASTYKVSVEADGFTPQDQNVTVATAPVTLQFSLQPKPSKQPEPPGPDTSVYWIAGLLAVYWIAILAARYHHIAIVNRNTLRAEINKAKQRAAAILSQPALTPVERDAHDRAQKLIEEAENLLDKARREYLRTFLYWSRGHEIAAWIQLHEADRFVTQTYDRDRTLARLYIAAQELRPDYAKVADLVDAALTAQANPEPDKRPSEESLKALLWEALNCVYDGRDNSFEMIFSWQNKAFTLMFAASCVLLVIANTNSNALLMLMGLSGGLVSRLWRGARGTDIPRDYGANWTTLFMSPIYGAFAGWFGVLMLVALKSIGVIGTTFDSLNWESAGKPLPLALAFLFGFSERLFTTVADSLENAVKDNLRKSAAGTTASQPADSSSASPATVVTPPAGPQITSMPFAFPGKNWTIEGKNLDGVQKVDLAGATSVSLAILSNKDGKLNLDVGAGVAAGQYDLLLDGKKVGGKVTVATWRIDSASWAGNTLTIDGNQLGDMPGPGMQKDGVVVTLAKDASSTATHVTATASASVAAGLYQLIAGGILTGDSVNVP